MIHDEKLVQKFASIFITDLDNNSVMMMFSATRKKYDPELKKECGSCRQQIISCKDTFVDKIRESYDDFVTKASVVYFHCNPRSLIKALATSVQTTQQETISVFNDICKAKKPNRKTVMSLVLSSIHKSVGEKRYVELDIDVKDEETIAKIMDVCADIIRPHLVVCIETRGGYHVIYKNKLSKQENTLLYKTFRGPDFKFIGQDCNGKNITQNCVDIRSDPSPPIPGTIQGGWNVKFSNLFK